MKHLRILIASLAVIASSSSLAAQKRSPPSGDWPLGYQALAFRGDLVDVGEDGMTFKLVFKGKKTEEFQGRIEQPCYNGKKGSKLNVPFTMKDFAPKSVVTAYYNVVIHNDNGQISRENVVIGLTLDAVGAKKLDPLRKIVTFCTGENRFEGRAFGKNPTD
jgi:hypothetical protein